MKKLIFLLFLPLAVVGQRVEEVGRAKDLVASAGTGYAAREVTVYCVEIFNDNSSSARAGAYSALSKFRELFPDISGDIRYNAPKYTVSVGLFLTHEEALVLCGKLKGAFRAYVRTEKRPLSTFSKLRE